MNGKNPACLCLVLCVEWAWGTNHDVDPMILLLSTTTISTMDDPHDDPPSTSDNNLMDATQ